MTAKRVEEKLTSRSARGLDRATLAAFGGAVFIGGLNFIAVRASNEELEPMFGAAVRFAAAAVILFALMAVLRLRLPDRRAAVGAAVYGLLGFGVSYGLLYFALVRLSAGTTSVIVAAAPLATLILAALHGQEKFSLRGLSAGLLVVGGIAVLSSRSIGGEVPFGYFAAALGGVVAIGESTVVARALPRPHPVTTNAVGMSVGAMFLFAASLVLRESWALPSTAGTWWAVAWLVVAGSVGLFLLVLFVIQRWTASAGAYAVTLMPVVAVTTGALVADEPLTVEVVAGGAVVLAGVYVGAFSGGRGARAPAPAADAAALAPSDAAATDASRP